MNDMNSEDKEKSNSFQEIDFEITVSDNNFNSYEEAVMEYKTNQDFKEAFSHVFRSYREEKGVPTNKLSKVDFFTMSNLIKSSVYYKDKSNLDESFYENMIEDAKDKVKEHFFPKEKIPTLKNEVLSVEKDSKNVCEFTNDGIDYDGGQAFIEAMNCRKNNETLSGKHCNVSKNKNTSNSNGGKFWN